MHGKTVLLNSAALLGCLSLLACGGGSNGKDGTDGAPGPSMLVRTFTEPAGNNCVAGGQKLQFGPDLNGDGQLEDAEVRETRYVCNGLSSTANVQTVPIAQGDVRCPSGGYALLITGGAGGADQNLAVCNGDSVTGPQGPQGATGPAAPEPSSFGQFIPVQFIKGAILSCRNLDPGEDGMRCTAPTINGLMIAHATALPNGEIVITPPDLSGFCRAITGKSGYVLRLGDGRDPASFAWNGDGWTFIPSFSLEYKRIAEITCTD